VFCVEAGLAAFGCGDVCAHTDPATNIRAAQLHSFARIVILLFDEPGVAPFHSLVVLLQLGHYAEILERSRVTFHIAGRRQLSQ